MLLDNEKGGTSSPLPVEAQVPISRKQRATMVGQLWSAGLAETLMEIYAPLLTNGYSLEDVSRLVQEPLDDRPGD